MRIEILTADSTWVVQFALCGNEPTAKISKLRQSILIALFVFGQVAQCKVGHTGQSVPS